ncbi:MAG: MFS transporter [Bryobacterales bacterium]|nr:MFS transporter [Bryobacterales bacterium]
MLVSPAAGKNYKWWVVAMLWFVCLFNYADRQAIFSVFPLLKTQMGLDDVQLGWVASSFMFVYAIAGPFAGIIGDRFSRRTLILGGLIFWSLVTIATALATQYWHLLLFRALEGLGEAFYFPASMSLLSDYHGKETRSRAMSWHQSSVYAGTIAGGTLAGYMADRFGWRSGFLLFGGLGVVLGIVLLAFLREPQRTGRAPAAHAHGDVADPSRKPQFVSRPMAGVLMAVFMGANFVAMIFLTWMPSYLNRAFNMSLTMAGFSATAYLQVASVAGVLCGGWLADRLVVRYASGRMRTQILGLFVGVPFIFVTGWTLEIKILVLAMAGFGFFKGLYDANIWASLHDVVPAERRATAVGAMNSLGWLAGFTAPPLMAAMSQRYGMGACLSANAVIYLVMGCLLTAGIMKWMKTPSRATAGVVP